ncbi:MAG: DUF4491 family protein [Rikenellaceae bacterium]|jgi:hypothetical protein|nr:DUF4491 family protein [Rikenellaceae bacterium]
MTEFLAAHNLTGLAIGIATFLIIGLFHPLVIKGEYYFGVQIWWAFLALGIGAGVASVLLDGLFIQIVAGVVAFSSLWSIEEVFHQRKRVQKGWFPENPKRKK